MLARVVTSIWVAVLVLGVAYGILVNDADDLNCEPTPGSSDYGDFAWSVLPPGPTCTFTEALHGFDGVRGPQPVISVWMATLAIGGMLSVATLRRSRPPNRTAARPGAH